MLLSGGTTPPGSPPATAVTLATNGSATGIDAAIVNLVPGARKARRTLFSGSSNSCSGHNALE
jgi:hypothetical protein